MSWYTIIKQAQQQNARYLATIHADVWVPAQADKELEAEDAKEAIRNSVHSGNGTLNNGTLYNTRFRTEVDVQPNERSHGQLV